MIQPDNNPSLHEAPPFDETEVIEECVKALLHLTIEEQNRVVRYLFDRFARR